jgi:hypothetical protein
VAERDLDDRLTRAIGIPGFGLSIPHLTGLFGPLGRTDAAFWWGHLLFVGLSAAIWQGNRWFLFQQRRHYGWFDRPVQKLILLLFAITFYTAPLTVATLWVWYRLAGFGPDWEVIRVVALANVICVVFVTHAYETVFLIKEREGDIVQVSRLERARAEAELSALRSQVDPHFLFNSLNTLGHLIDTDPARAQAFNDHLARVYRYLLATRDRHLVTLAEELDFVSHYVALLRLRFGDSVALEILADGVDAERALVPPTALQALVENAVKHNSFHAEQPLRMRLALSPGHAELRNPLRLRAQARPSAGVGLANLRERYRLAGGREIEAGEERGEFRVSVPLLPLRA